MKRRFLITNKGVIIRTLVDDTIPDIVLVDKDKIDSVKFSENGQDVTINLLDGSIEQMFIYPNGLVSCGTRETDWDDNVANIKWKG